MSSLVGYSALTDVACVTVNSITKGTHLRNIMIAYIFAIRKKHFSVSNCLHTKTETWSCPRSSQSPGKPVQPSLDAYHQWLEVHSITLSNLYFICLPSSCAWRLWWRWRPPPTAIPPSATPTATSTEDTDTEDTAAASEAMALDMALAAADTEVDTADMEDTTPDMDMADIAVD